MAAGAEEGAHAVEAAHQLRANRAHGHALHMHVFMIVACLPSEEMVRSGWGHAHEEGDELLIGIGCIGLLHIAPHGAQRPQLMEPLVEFHEARMAAEGIMHARCRCRGQDHGGNHTFVEHGLSADARLPADAYGNPEHHDFPPGAALCIWVVMLSPECAHMPRLVPSFATDAKQGWAQSCNADEAIEEAELGLQDVCGQHHAHPDNTSCADSQLQRCMSRIGRGAEASLEVFLRCADHSLRPRQCESQCFAFLLPGEDFTSSAAIDL